MSACKHASWREMSQPRESSVPANLFVDAIRDCRVAQVSTTDAASLSDTWNDLQNLVLPSGEKYPQIDRWLNDKVRKGVTSGGRAAFVGYHAGKPAVAAIVKLGETAKFCHLSVTPVLRGRNVGELFFSLMTMMAARAKSRAIRFTLPEGLWEEQRSFFESFTFKQATPIGRQYRLFERELYCESPLNDVWAQVVNKLGKLRGAMSLDGAAIEHDLVLSVRPEFADRILSGIKTVEIRRSFATHRAPARCMVYSSSPIQAVVGSVDVAKAFKIEPKTAWGRYGAQMGCTWSQLEEYAGDAEQVVALELANPYRYQREVPLCQLRSLISSPLHPPQSYSLVSDGSGWANAMPVIAMLQTGVHL